MDEAIPKMAPQLAVLDKAVAKTGFLSGPTFTLADMYLVPILYYLSRVPESSKMLAEHANLAAYFARHMERPSVKSTIPPPVPKRG